MNPLTDAIVMVTHLVKTCRMALMDACRAAAREHGVDYHKLYHIMTD